MKDLLRVIYLGCFPVQACPIAHDFPPDGYYVVTLRTTQTGALLSSWKPPILLPAQPVYPVSILPVLISVMLSV